MAMAMAMAMAISMKKMLLCPSPHAIERWIPSACFDPFLRFCVHCQKIAEIRRDLSRDRKCLLACLLD
jgi:hypothetical protein